MVRPLGQMPHQKTVYGAKAQLIALCPGAIWVHFIQQPGEFCAGKIRVDDESGGLLNQRRHVPPVGLTRGTTLGCQILAVSRTASILPDNCVIQGARGLAFPQQRGFTLIGDPNTNDGGGFDVCLRDGLSASGQNRRPDHVRVLFYPAIVWIRALDTLLGATHYRTSSVVHKCATA